MVVGQPWLHFWARSRDSAFHLRPLPTQVSSEPGFCHHPNPHPPPGLSEPQLLFGRTDGFLFYPWQKMNSLF